MRRPDGKVVQGEVIREDGTDTGQGPDDGTGEHRPPLDR